MGGTNRGVLALRWNGSTWKRTAATSTGHRGLVGGGLDRRPTSSSAWATTGPTRATARLAQAHQRHGSSIQHLEGPRRADPPGPRATLTDVIALPGGKAWAVGTRLQNGRLRAYAATLERPRWCAQRPLGRHRLGPARRRALSIGHRLGRGLEGVRAWAARARTSSSARAASWKAIKVSGVPAGPAVLTDVSFRGGNDGYAVGYLSPEGSDKHYVILQRWDGNAWSMVDLPWADDFAAVPRVGLGGPTDGSIWIAGTKTANDKREPRGFIAHRKDGELATSTCSTRPRTSARRSWPWPPPATGAVAAATVGASLLVLKACGETASAVSVASAKQGTSQAQH